MGEALGCMREVLLQGIPGRIGTFQVQVRRMSYLLVSHPHLN